VPLYIISWLPREKVRQRLHPKKIMVSRLILTPNSFARALNDLKKRGREREDIVRSTWYVQEQEKESIFV
jgi:hypothetical protein